MWTVKTKILKKNAGIFQEKKTHELHRSTAAKIELVAGETPQVSPWIFGNQELFRSSRLNLRETGNLCQGWNGGWWWINQPLGEKYAIIQLDHETPGRVWGWKFNKNI